MWRTVRPFVVAVAVCAAGAFASADEKAQIPGGIPGKVVSVDAQAGSLTISTNQGTQRTFAVTNDTTMVGPRGGKVRRRLKDRRFHEGLPVTIVADGKTATEIHLGYDRHTADAGSSGGSQGGTAATTAGSAARVTPAPAPSPSPSVRTSKKVDVTTDQGRPAPGADDEDTEVPGKVKRFDHDRRLLVITLVNGKDRAFLLSKDVAVMVKGRKSRQGLDEPAIRTGAAVEVLTDEGGHKVKELKIVSAKR